VRYIDAAYTHLQPAEPVLVTLAAGLCRNVSPRRRSLADCRKRANCARWDRARWPEPRSRSTVKHGCGARVDGRRPTVSTLRATGTSPIEFVDALSLLALTSAAGLKR